MMDRLLMKNRNSSFLRSKKKLPSIRRCGMSNSNNRHKYDDIINLPHHTSPTRPRMTMIDRAAQFSPFAALTGYDAAVKETARLTENRIELDEYEKSALNDRLQIVQERLSDTPVISIKYLVPDERKSGCAY